MFSTEIAQSLLIYVDYSVLWPNDVKNEILMNDFEVTDKLRSSKGGAVPRVLYLHIQDINGEEVDLQSHHINFKAWISGRESELLTEETTGCGFADLNGHSSLYLNIRNLPTPWSAGETLKVQPMTHNPDSVIFSYVLDNSGSPIFSGFEPLIPGSGQPLQLDMDNAFPLETSINLTGTIITVSWDEQWRAVGYNLYWADKPEGPYSFAVNTANTIWQFSIVGSKKFYKVTAVYEDKGEK